MNGIRLAWLLLVVVAGSATAQNEPPEEDFLDFLGGLEADDDWELFFESVPDDAPEQVAGAEETINKTEDQDELD